MRLIEQWTNMGDYFENPWMSMGSKSRKIIKCLKISKDRQKRKFKMDQTPVKQNCAKENIQMSNICDSKSEKNNLSLFLIQGSSIRCLRFTFIVIKC